jgi:hypothetical protein
MAGPLVKKTVAAADFVWQRGETREGKIQAVRDKKKGPQLFEKSCGPFGERAEESAAF